MTTTTDTVLVSLANLRVWLLRSRSLGSFECVLVLLVGVVVVVVGRPAVAGCVDPKTCSRRATSSATARTYRELSLPVQFVPLRRN